MTDIVYMQRKRFDGRDIDSFVISAQELQAHPGAEIHLPASVEGTPNGPKIGLILALEKGFDGYVIDEPYVQAIIAAGGNPRFISYQNVAKQMQDIDLDGVFLIGGSFDSPAQFYLHPEHLPRTHQNSLRALAYLAAIDFADSKQLPIFGVCAGFQMLAGSRGAKLYLNLQQELHSEIIHKTDKQLDAHQVALVPGSKLYEISGQVTDLAVNSVHSEGMAEPKIDNLIVSARSADGNVEAIELFGERFVIGVQWHPEYLYQRSLAAANLFAAFVVAAKACEASKK